LFTLNGNASSRTARVVVVGRPEAVFAWVPTTSNLGLWTVTGVALSSGANVLTVNAVDSEGVVIGTAAINVTLSVNAPPVAVLVAEPSTLKVAANEPVVFDGTGSFDPEGGVLTYAWSVVPATGFSASGTVAGRREYRFFVPGVYAVTMTVTDAQGAVGVQTRDVTVYNSNDDLSFGGGDPAAAGYLVENVEYRDNFSPGAYYSLEDFSGRLVIDVRDTVALPLTTVSPAFPMITRALGRLRIITGAAMTAAPSRLPSSSMRKMRSTGSRDTIFAVAFTLRAIGVYTPVLAPTSMMVRASRLRVIQSAADTFSHPSSPRQKSSFSMR
jgi:hypothetical protein